MLMVEELEGRLTPCSMPAPVAPGDPPPAIVCDECEACEDGCIGIILDDADIAAIEALNRMGEAEANLEDNTEYEVSLVWSAPPVNPFLAQYQNLTNAELKGKALEARTRANGLLADALAIQNRDYSGITGAGWAAVDSAYLPILFMNLQEVRLEIEAILQIHNSR